MSRQSKKKKQSPPETKISEESTLDDTKSVVESKQEDEVEGATNELVTKIDDKTEKELDDSELDTNTVKNEKEIVADESLADVESLPESQPEQPVKSSSSKSSKRSTDRKSKSRSSRASKYVEQFMKSTSTIILIINCYY